MPSSRPSARRLLLVDDDSGIRQATASLLRTMHTDVVTARDEKSAMTEFREQGPFDVVLTGLGIEGDEVLRAIRRDNPTQKVAVVSGWPETEVRTRFDASDVPDVVLRKPATKRQLQDLLEAADPDAK